jgi:hypothetical protein
MGIGSVKPDLFEETLKLLTKHGYEVRYIPLNGVAGKGK